MIVYLMVLHFISDFVLQSREMGKKKSSDFVWLLRHLLIICSVFYIGLVPFLFMRSITGPKFLFVPLLNVIIHGLIDMNIWNVYKFSVLKRGGDITWKYWDDHLFYTTIGFDQMLHTITLIILWNVL